MIAPARKVKGLREWTRDAQKAVSPEAIFKKIDGTKLGDEIIRIVISEAHLGRGPMGERYKSYSEAYARRKGGASGGVAGNWLRGIDTPGTGTGMLAFKNFSWEFKGETIWLVWTAADAAQAIYGTVHNEGVGKMPKREWMHLDSIRGNKIAMKVIEQALNETIADYATIWGR